MERLPITARQSSTPPAPRAMVDGAIAIAKEEIITFAKTKVYPRLLLFQALTETGYCDDHARHTTSDDRLIENRRMFLNSFAYLCDVEPGGRTVTATALQELPRGNILWLAANEGIRADVKNYAQRLLDFLKLASASNADQLQSTIHGLAIEHCTQRLAYYIEQVKRYATKCRIFLKNQIHDPEARDLRRKLKRLSQPPPAFTRAQYIEFCLNLRAREYSLFKQRKHSCPEFDKLAHYVWRVGATRSAVNDVVSSMIEDLSNSSDSSLGKISGLRTVDAPETLAIRVPPINLLPLEVLYDIFTDSSHSQNIVAERNAFNALLSRDTPRERLIHRQMKREANIDIRVHCELQLADRFSRQNLNFVGQDRYIGCSKRACYFCFHWLESHGYVPPPTHNKVILGCRGPDGDLNEAGVRIIRGLYQRLSAQLGRDVLGALLEDRVARNQHMSTEGPTPAASQV